MFSIGEFAHLGLVSVRMVRHYDALGLLRPAHVDAATGYRSYEAAQLATLNRIVVLKDLGFTLEQVRSMLDDDLDPAELRGMLRLRHTELESRIDRDRARLRRVRSRLSAIEGEGDMSADVIVKSVPAVRLAELSAVAEGYLPEHIGPVIGPLYPELCRRVESAGLRVTGPAVAHYEDDGDQVVVHAGVPVDRPDDVPSDVPVRDLPALPTSASLVHRGSMDGVMDSLNALARWIEDNGYRAVGHAREVYLDYDPDRAEEGVTELQVPVEAV